MQKSKLIGFNTGAVRANMFAAAVEEQNRRFVEYAKQRIMLIGEAITMYHSRHNMDDTGNLLDSLCWGVLYNGKYVDYGFYRQQKATTAAVLHDFWKGGEIQRKTSVEDWLRYKKNGQSYLLWDSYEKYDLPEIWGHKMAQEFIERKEKSGKSGWQIFFAILAPYWGYWEKGFTMRHGNYGSTFLQFAVMSQFADHVRSDIPSSKVNVKVHVEKYSNTGLMKQARREARRRERESNRRNK